MIEGLQPYPRMQATDVPWLPELPAGWSIHRAKYSFHEVDDRSASGDEELLSVSHKTGVTPRSQKNITMFMAESYEGHKVCKPGDIVVNTMWAWMAAIGVSRNLGIVSPAYGVYRQRASGGFEPRYLDYLLRTKTYSAEYLRSSRGVTTSRLRLYPPDFLNIPFAQPSREEQRQIVRFLDWHGAETAKLIRAKRNLIALLNEQKQAIIHQAVTRGLDPNVKLQPSGVPWLGDVPEGWAVVALGRVVELITGFPFKSEGFTTNEDDIRLLRGINVGLGVIRWEKVVRWSKCKARSYARYSLTEGDIVLGMDRPLIAGGTRAAAISQQDAPSLLLQRVALVRPSSMLVPEFALLLLHGAGFRTYLTPIFTGISVPHLSPEQIKAFKIALPTVAEQFAIVESLGKQNTDLDGSIAASQREIDLIIEFRTRLIADVVTGKLDVRAAAADVPEASDFMPLDDPIDESDDEEADMPEDEEETA